MADISEVETAAQFAERVKTSSGNVFNWIEKAKVKPFAKFGNTNVYLITDLTSAMEKHATSAKSFKALGYVHPDQYKAVQDLHASAVQETLQLHEENDKLAAELEELQDASVHQDALYMDLLANFNSIAVELAATRSAALNLSE